MSLPEMFLAFLRQFGEESHLVEALRNSGGDFDAALQEVVTDFQNWLDSNWESFAGEFLEKLRSQTRSQPIPVRLCRLREEAQVLNEEADALSRLNFEEELEKARNRLAYARALHNSAEELRRQQLGLLRYQFRERAAPIVSARLAELARKVQGLYEEIAKAALALKQLQVNVQNELNRLRQFLDLSVANGGLPSRELLRDLMKGFLLEKCLGSDPSDLIEKIHEKFAQFVPLLLLESWVKPEDILQELHQAVAKPAGVKHASILLGRTTQPLLAAWTGSESVAQAFQQRGILVFNDGDPTRAFVASFVVLPLDAIDDWGEWADCLLEKGGDKRSDPEPWKFEDHISIVKTFANGLESDFSAHLRQGSPIPRAQGPEDGAATN